VGMGVNVTTTLVISQVILSITLPLPMIALLIFTRRHDIMGSFVISPLMSIIAIVATILVLALNLVLILQTFGLL
jgi:manganese transport protein